ncbi:MAG: discoidin domain-containing protein [Elusimicrobia bacterium]|nr:discoidin domain-containing protein [Elusimicrobiota bacterium]
MYGPDIRAWASTEGASLPAAHAVDGDERTRWAGQAIDPQWLAVDFRETRAFDTVRLVWEGGVREGLPGAGVDGQGELGDCWGGDGRGRWRGRGGGGRATGAVSSDLRAGARDGVGVFAL